MKTPAQLYKYHSANVGRIEEALDRVELHLRRAVADDDRKSVKAMLPLYSLLLGASAETQLMKILFEPKVFEESQRTAITTTKRHLDRWHQLLETAFRNHYKLNEKTQITQDTIDINDYHIFQELKSLLDNELQIIIEIRNKLAHGQWEYPLNDDFSDVLPNKKKILNQENLLTLQLKRTIIKNLIFIIRDLAVSHRTLHRDFHIQHRRIKYARLNIKNRSYPKYKQTLIDRKLRGWKKRMANYAAKLTPPKL